MKSPATTKIENISEWLDIATKDLAPSAKQRITREIQNHYADALQAHVEENQNPSDASSTALNELGDPSRAAKIYCKKYLTLKEDEEIRNLLALSSKSDARSV